jgi:charged multivesicular body protein 7
MKSYESSASTLRDILAHPALQRESIDATLGALDEANTDARELDDIIRMGTLDIMDEDELENELNGLIREAEMDKQARADLEAAETQRRLEDTMNTPQGLPSAGENSRILETTL